MFMTTGRTSDYILTFRCVNCGAPEALARLSAEGTENEDELLARIYQVICTACGWKGNVCGVSAILVSRLDCSKASAA
jgi:hypothetical protein